MQHMCIRCLWHSTLDRGFLMGSQRHGISMRQSLGPSTSQIGLVNSMVPVARIPLTKTLRRKIVARSNWRFVTGTFWFACMLGCGPDAPVKRPHSGGDESAQRRHNYSAVWIYAIGEVDSLGSTECSKAVNLLEGETNCKARTCRYARELARDYLASCRTVGGVKQVS